MDALMAALVVAALAMIGERPAWLAARLADRARSPGMAIAAALVALLAACGLAAALGATLAPRLTPEAKLLMLALSLLLLGGGAVGRVKPPAASDGAAGFAGATLAVAAVLGEAGWRALPLRAARLVVAIGFLLVGAVLALQALDLV